MGHAGQGAFANEYRYAAFPAADDIFFYRDPYRHFDNESNRIDIDAHILTTPAIADVNDDGHIELVVAISYYFDTEKYSSISDIDPTKYVAGGLGAWDLESKDWAWLVHLDLTTSDTSYMAYMYSSPVVVDIDGDGRQEVVVGTAMGLVYVLDANTGFVKRHFPQQVAPLRAQISVSDVVGDSGKKMLDHSLLVCLVWGQI
jgi:outer membrane protein assembly factor BamB